MNIFLCIFFNLIFLITSTAFTMHGNKIISIKEFMEMSPHAFPVIDDRSNFSESAPIKTSRSICEHCGKSYKRAHSFRDHINKHTHSKPHQCTVCSKNFTYAGSLANHLTAHKKAKKNRRSLLSSDETYKELSNKCEELKNPNTSNPTEYKQYLTDLLELNMLIEKFIQS